MPEIQKTHTSIGGTVTNKHAVQEQVRQEILHCYNKGMTKDQMIDHLKEKGLKRADGKDFVRKDIDNRILNLRKSGQIKDKAQAGRGRPPKTQKEKTTSTKTKSITIKTILKRTGIANPKQLADKLELPYSTVLTWKNRGIPDKRLPEMIKFMDSYKNSSTTKKPKRNTNKGTRAMCLTIARVKKLTDLTQNQIAQELEIHPATVSSWNQKGRTPKNQQSALQRIVDQHSKGKPRTSPQRRISVPEPIPVPEEQQDTFLNGNVTNNTVFILMKDNKCGMFTPEQITEAMLS